MTLQTNGAISLADIQTEFGGSNPAGLDEYYDGGANVPINTYGSIGKVPSSGAISLRDFYGTTKNVVIAVSTRTITSGTYWPSTAYSAFRVTSSGFITQLVSNPWGSINETFLEQWCTPVMSAPGFEIKIIPSPFRDFDSGSSPTGTWLSLETATYTWFITDSSQQSPFVEFTAQIRRRGTETPITEGYITLEASQL